MTRLRVSRLVPIALLVALAACAGHSNLLPLQPAFAAPVDGLGRPRDLGRRSRGAPVHVVVLLRYNHESQFDALFADLQQRGSRHRYLTQQEFRDRFSPTPQQHDHVLAALSAAGFRIERTYSNRLIVDAVAPSSTVERFFQTTMHTYGQSRFGERFANVTPAVIPATLQSVVAAVGLDDLVRARPASQIVAAPPAAANAVENPGFETGGLAPWYSCAGDGGTATAVVSTYKPHSGHYDAFVGTANSKTPEVHGLSAVCQSVRVPTNGRLTLYVKPVGNDPSNAVQIGGITAASGTSLGLFEMNENSAAWIPESFDLSRYAGQTVLIYFGVFASATHPGKFNGLYLDDVSLVTDDTPPVRLCPGQTKFTGTFGPDGGWGPGSIAQGLCYNSLYGDTGAGQTIGVVMSATIAPTDLTGYLKYFGITRKGSLKNIAVDGPAGTDPDFALEATLDIETVAALAPAANVRVYTMPDSSWSHLVDAYNRIVSDGVATVINTSLQGCEDPTWAPMMNAIAAGAATQGVTFAAASGDNGSACYATGSTFAFGVNSPASGSAFVSVGGTQSLGPYYVQPLFAPNAILNPAVWKQDGTGNTTGAGGVSKIFKLPSYQSGIDGVVKSGRNVPDIALPAIADSLYVNGKWEIVGGTSWSSPLYTAMQAEINQACGAGAWGINTMYDAFAATGYKYDFIDVTMGNNGYLGYKPYEARPGFDQVSGIGIPVAVEAAYDNGCGHR